MKNPAAGGGRWLEVPPERFTSWVAAFAERHSGDGGAPVSGPPVSGPPVSGPSVSGPSVSGPSVSGTVTFTAADGAVAECHPPFPPGPVAGSGISGAVPVEGVRAVAAAFAEHAAADRTVGVLLVRLGGYAVGVFSGTPPRLVSSKTGSRPVHGRSAAGGWSQHRFARRRENQAATALRAAADAAAEVFGRYGPDRLDAVVLGGDKRSAAGLRGDVRLEKYLAKATGRFLTVPDPRLAVLREVPRAFLAIRIRLTEP